MNVDSRVCSECLESFECVGDASPLICPECLEHFEHEAALRSDEWEQAIASDGADLDYEDREEEP